MLVGQSGGLKGQPDQGSRQSRDDGGLSEESRALRKEPMNFQEVTGACLENTKVNPEESKASLEEMEAVLEWQEVCNEEMNMDIIGALEDRCGRSTFACTVPLTVAGTGAR
jgi:hypothetical protein